jgi:hypothetical protein
LPTLKFRIKGVEFEFIGEQEEIMAFINRFMYEGASLDENRTPNLIQREDVEGLSTSTNVQTLRKKPVSKDGVMPLPVKLTDMPLPSIDAVINYILQKPLYKHDLPEIQMKFFGRVFQSRGADQRMWHRTARQLKMAREIIEKRFGGKFKEGSAGERNLKQYTFASSQVTLPTAERQKTSS